MIRAVVVAVVGIVLLVPAGAGADAVDEAFTRGNEAATSGDWDAAIANYEEATRLLPGPNSALAYNLGTAHAHAGHLGQATYHLRRSLEPSGGASAEIVEAARYNLAWVRRRADLSATTGGAQIDRPQTWWDLVVDAMRAPLVGWVALLCGWGLVLLWLLRKLRPSRRRNTGTALGTALVILALGYLVPGTMYGLAARADSVAPEAIALPDKVDVRDGPGMHRKISFVLQGGARVRMVDHTPGWVRVRLPGGLEGWVPQMTVATLDRGRDRRRDASSPGPSVGAKRPDNADSSADR